MDAYANLSPHTGFDIPAGRAPASEISLEARDRAARCAQVVKYCMLVQQHVVEYDSLDTAATILGRAIGMCPSIEARVELVKANRLLRAAIKAQTWLNSRRRRRHVDASTRNRNLDRFADALSEGILHLETETKRNNASLIEFISSQYTTDLPLTLPDSKTFTVQTVPIVVMLAENARLDPAVAHLRIESRLMLIKRAHVIGVNTDRVRNREIDRVNAAALQRYGCMVYEAALRRPSSNINWYLLQDFHAEIVYAGFVDYLEIDTRSVAAESKIRTQRLRDLRMAFEVEHIDYIQQIAALRGELDNAKDTTRQLSVAFTELTAVHDTDPGLSANAVDYPHLAAHLHGHYEKLLRLGTPVVVARADTLAQRLAARATYYGVQDSMRVAKELRREIKRLQHELDARRANRALSLGFVGNRDVMEF